MFILSKNDFWKAVRDIVEKGAIHQALCADDNTVSPEGILVTGAFFPPFPSCLIIGGEAKREYVLSTLEKCIKSLHPDYLGSRPSVTKETFVFYGNSHEVLVASLWISLNEMQYPNVAVYAGVQKNAKPGECPFEIYIGVVYRPLLDISLPYIQQRHLGEISKKEVEL